MKLGLPAFLCIVPNLVVVPSDKRFVSFSKCPSFGLEHRLIVVLGLDPRTNPRFNRRVPYYVYILASRRHGTLYLGVTNDLVRRVYEHRCGALPGFASRYGVRRLVWFEAHDDVIAAIQREKNLKHWLRAWKVALIERTNPDWSDLYDEIAS